MTGDHAAPGRARTLLSRLRLRGKLVAISLLSSAVCLTLAGAILVGYDNVAHRARTERQYRIQAEIVGASVSAPLVFADADAGREQLAALGADPDIEAAAVYDVGGDLFAAHVREGGGARLPDRLEEARAVEGGELVGFSAGVEVGGRTVGSVLLLARMEPVSSRAARYAGVIGLVMLVSLVFTLPFSLWLGSAISDPVRRMAEAASAVSGGDLTVRVVAEPGDDEIGVLSRTFASMVESLRSLNREIGEGVEVLGGAVEQIVLSSRDVSTAAEQSATSTSATAAIVESARKSAQAAADRAVRMSETAADASRISEDGRQAVDRSIDGIGRARAEMETVGERMAELSDRTLEILRIITTVDDLAGQSNVLAVNAAIEAAKAGDRGRTFAVVAREIRALSEQSSRATVDVRGILDQIREALGAAVAAAKQGTEVVQASSEDSVLAGEAIRSLEERVGRAAAVAEDISDTCLEQVASMARAATAMAEIATATERNVADARRTESAARAIGEMGEKLRELTSRYET